MTPSEVLAHYGGSHRQVARALGLKSHGTVVYWCHQGRVPIHHQRHLEFLTGGELKADAAPQHKSDDSG